MRTLIYKELNFDRERLSLTERQIRITVQLKLESKDYRGFALGCYEFFAMALLSTKRWPCDDEQIQQTLRELAGLRQRMRDQRTEELELLISHIISEDGREWAERSIADLMRKLPRARSIIRFHLPLDLEDPVAEFDEMIYAIFMSRLGEELRVQYEEVEGEPGENIARDLAKLMEATYEGVSLLRITYRGQDYVMDQTALKWFAGYLAAVVSFIEDTDQWAEVFDGGGSTSASTKIPSPDRDPSPANT